MRRVPTSVSPATLNAPNARGVPTTAQAVFLPSSCRIHRVKPHVGQAITPISLMRSATLAIVVVLSAMVHLPPSADNAIRDPSSTRTLALATVHWANMGMCYLLCAKPVIPFASSAQVAHQLPVKNVKQATSYMALHACKSAQMVLGAIRRRGPATRATQIAQSV